MLRRIYTTTSLHVDTLNKIRMCFNASGYETGHGNPEEEIFNLITRGEVVSCRQMGGNVPLLQEI